MINYISIHVKDPKHVANVLAEILEGQANPFLGQTGSYKVFSSNEYVAIIELHPIRDELIPRQNDERESSLVDFHTCSCSTVQATLFVPKSQTQIEQIANREGWQVLPSNRDGLFDVIQFWVENRLILELLPPAIAPTQLYACDRDRVTRFAAEQAVA